MIPNQWYAILESREVKRGKITQTIRMGEKLIAWRDTHGNVTVMSEKCPHRGASLAEGKLVKDCLACAFHGFEFDTKGACTIVPANGKNSVPPKAMQVRTYPTREEHDFIYIWWGEAQSTLPPVPWFESIGPEMAYTTLKDHWATHYARAIENQLDVVHLPFIHHNTIGRGQKTLVNGPVVSEEHCWPGDHLINLWVMNEVDRGQTPRRASELPLPDRRPFLQFRYGNLWHNWIADSVRVVIAFAPIDAENSLLYIRYYHNLHLPIIRQVYGWIGSLGNLLIERQDRRVVVTQQPPRPDLGIGEILIPGDGPIVMYRKIRRSLIEEKG